MLQTGLALSRVRATMNLKKFIRWPRPLNAAVHLRRVHELLSDSNPAKALADTEIQRAAEIRSLAQRRAFLAARKLAREVLSVPLNCAPEAVPILGASNGKPGILGGDIQFNLSHCEDWCAIAWSAESIVGVDVEVIRPVPDMETILNNYFPPAAQRDFYAARPQEQTAVFFRWWRQIEAALKASGDSLDDSYVCLNHVLHAVCDGVPGVALAVAAVGKGPLTITWHLP